MGNAHWVTFPVQGYDWIAWASINMFLHEMSGSGSMVEELADVSTERSENAARAC
jgi:hypothetical protein